MGLSDREQAVVNLISAMLISAAAISVPSGAPYWVTVALAMCGSAGFALKELGGGKAPAGVSAPTVKRRYCPECSKEQPLHTRYCYNCGAELPKGKLPVPQPSSEEAAIGS